METGQPYVPCFVEGTPGLFLAPFGVRRVRAWFGPVVRLHALDHLRRELSDRRIQERIGELYLAQLRAFQHRAAADRA
jgi:1-acyl-sn-glycerol-3-phosphate acyltransferase